MYAPTTMHSKLAHLLPHNNPQHQPHLPAAGDSVGKASLCGTDSPLALSPRTSFDLTRVPRTVLSDSNIDVSLPRHSVASSVPSSRPGNSTNTSTSTSAGNSANASPDTTTNAVSPPTSQGQGQGQGQGCGYGYAYGDMDGSGARQRPCVGPLGSCINGSASASASAGAGANSTCAFPSAPMDGHMNGAPLTTTPWSFGPHRAAAPPVSSCSISSSASLSRTLSLSAPSVPTRVPTSVPASSLSNSAACFGIKPAASPSARLDSGTSSNSSPTGVAPISSATASPTSPSPRSTKPPFNVKMPPRPAKRSADGSVASDDDANPPSAGKVKLARSDRGPEDFSSVIKNRLQSYTRTGQACDRCKVRKIRCDALPEGCSHCINLNLECFVTDRVTGRTERRGYMQQLEREKKSMMSHIHDLEQLCREKGVDVRPFQGAVRSQSPPEDDLPKPSAASAFSEGWSQFGSLWIKDSSFPRPASSFIRYQMPRTEWQTRPEKSRWGIGSDDAPLSSLKGMTLTLLGTTIETTAFDAPDVDEPPTAADPCVPLYNKSLQAFLRSTMGVNPPVQVELPTRENAFMYAEWYFITVGSFIPLLHKPTFMKLLAKVYDEPSFKPTVPELVLVHMVFAIILFQFGVRNSQTLEQRNNFNDLSNKHYHFALSKMYDIFSSTEFEALQGLVLIASHTRAFPKPGCGSIVASMALHRAIELNYHRRTKKPGEVTDLQNELRKRVWWNMLTVVVDINGKRGYPIPVSVQDFDVDFPEPIADELLSDEGVDASRTLPCPYEVAIAGFKCIPAYMEMYANVFSVRRDESSYNTVVAALEAQMDQWEAELPETMRLDPPKKHDHEMVGPLFARTYMLEFRLRIRHPSLAMTTDTDMIAENTRICEEAAREYLEIVERLSRMKALDTTWHQMSVYCVAILSMLVPQWERRFEVTTEELTKLRDEMERWMKVVKEMSALLGCGTGMSTQIAQLINRTMAWIEHDMPQKDMAASIHGHANIKQEHQQQQQPLQGTMSLATHNGQQQHKHTDPFGGPSAQHPSLSSASASGEGQLAKDFYQSNNTVPTYPPLAYIDQRGQAVPQLTASYQHDQAGLFYPTTTQATASAQHAAGAAQADSLVGYAPEAGQHLNHQSSDMMWRSSWQNWSAAIADSQERYSANALLNLGNADSSRSSDMTPMMAGNGMPQTGGELPMVPQPASWPLIMFDQTPQE